MYRSHQETLELVAARVSDYVGNHVSEDVLSASLKALGLDKDEIRYELFKAYEAKKRALSAGRKP